MKFCLVGDTWEDSPNYTTKHFVCYDLKAFKHLGKVFLMWKLIYIPVRSFCIICSVPPLLPSSLYLQAVNGQGTLPHIHLGNGFEGRKPL